MKDELFTELIASVKEGAQILKNEKEASRSFPYDRRISDISAKNMI
jgi:hypothetical protein